MNKINLVAFLVLTSSIPVSAAAADNYQCTNGNLERRVQILYEPGRAVPCQVQYFKDTEAPGEPQVLWSAQNQSGYCESKAAAFITQLQSQGWSCNSSAGEDEVVIVEEDITVDDGDADDEVDVVVEEVIETDDTDTLAPAEDNN